MNQVEVPAKCGIILRLYTQSTAHIGASSCYKSRGYAIESLRTHHNFVHHGFGRRGHTCELSKLGAKSTVSKPRSASMTADDTACNRHSVYRMAAGGSLSKDPKFPCPATCQRELRHMLIRHLRYKCADADCMHVTKGPDLRFSLR